MQTKTTKGLALGLSLSLIAPTVLVGCGGQSPPPATGIAPPNGMAPQTASKPGLTTKQKVVLLAGAAALYYAYNRFKHSNTQLANQKVQYYLSQNGRVYYRDPNNPQNVIWVTPPPAENPTYSLPADQAQQYSNFEGYNGQRSGQTLRNVFPVQ